MFIDSTRSVTRMNEDQCPDYKETISKLAANATMSRLRYLMKLKANSFNDNGNILYVLMCHDDLPSALARCQRRGRVRPHGKDLN
jgi:hypothetical protein